MTAPCWLGRLQLLAARCPGLCISPDLAALTLAEAWGLYRALVRIAGGADAG
jgi:hypothetical protein